MISKGLRGGVKEQRQEREPGTVLPLYDNLEALPSYTMPQTSSFYGHGGRHLLFLSQGFVIDILGGKHRWMWRSDTF